MRYRVLVFAFIALLFTSPSQALYFSGELTTSDSVAADVGFGEFYYDLYYVVVDAPMIIEVFMTPTDPFAPWLGYWGGDFTGTPDYDTPPPLDLAFSTDVGEQLYLAFDAMPGINYQIMAATYYYNPTDLGAYNFFVVDPGRTDMGFSAATSPIEVPQSVPAPASWIILGLGLMALLFMNRPGVRTKFLLVPAARGILGRL